jgi:hypothetical protein
MPPLTTPTGVPPTLLFHTFFSGKNITSLQHEIRFSVNKWSGFNIGEQSLLELQIIMKNAYDKYAHEIDETRTSRRELYLHNQQQIRWLNEIVINLSVPLIIDAVEQHLAFLKAFDTPVSKAGLERPINTNTFGTIQYKTASDIFGEAN